MRTESLTLDLPGGLADGTRIRVPAKGHVGRDGGESGDLYITVHVQPHPVFRRDGDDLHVVVPLAVHEAALGRADRRADARGPTRPARAARHAVGPALPHARARSAVARRDAGAI